MRSETIIIATGVRPTVADLTATCNRFVTGAGDGLLNVFVPHATAGLAIIETGAGSDDDLLRALDELLPRDARWSHRHGTAGHGRDHVLPGFVSPSVTVPGPGRAAATGYLAVNLPGGHQRRQPRAHGPAQLAHRLAGAR
jgi:thiamine phosphate synthase YjbQ (UPF0047 family)